MATGQLGGAISYLRRIMGAQDVCDLTDRQLLECFLADRDETAFEALVRRHGAMVMGVCRRVLHDPNDAEDAFQATFLVLVRKAGSLAQPDLLGNWLYGVAYRTAREARARTARRRAQEKQAMNTLQSEPPEEIWNDLRPVLDEELSRLPAKYRVPVVLCDLESKSRKEVARQIGCPEGTVSSRLARAREILRKRLTRRGVGLSVGSLTVLLSQGSASASVPAPLVVSTVKAAALVAAGKAAAAGAISAPVAALMEGVLQAMFVTKLKITTVVLLTLGVVGTGAGVLTHQALADKPAAAKPKDPAAEQADKPAKPDKGDKADDGLAVTAIVKAVDAAKGTIHVLLIDKGKKEPVEQTFTLGAGAKVLLPTQKKGEGQPEGKLADLAEGANVLLTLAADKKTVVGITIHAPILNGVVKAVDAAKNTLTVTAGGKKQPDDLTLTVPADAKIVLPGGKKDDPAPEGKLADLTPGTEVSLQLSVDRKTAQVITVHVPKVGGKVKAVDSAKSTITIESGKKDSTEQTFTMAGDVKILFPAAGKKDPPTEGKLADLKPGSQVALTLSLDRKMVTVITIYPPSASGAIKKLGADRITIVFKGEGGPTEKTFALAKDVLITLPDGKKQEQEGKLADLVEDLAVTLTLSLDEKTVHAISVAAPSVSGGVSSVDAANHTVTITVKQDGNEQARTFTVAKDARITLAGADKDQEGKLSELPQGSEAVLQLSVDRKTVHGISASGGGANGTVTTLDSGSKSITINVKEDGNLVDKTFDLARDINLTDVAQGVNVSLRLSIDKKTVIGIHVNKEK